MEIQVDQQQLQKIVSKLGPQLYERAVKDMMNIAANEGRNTMMNKIRGGTTFAVQSIHAKATPTTAEVYSIIKTPTGMKIEEGRKPGDAPSLKQVANWSTGNVYAAKRIHEFGRGEIEQFKAIQEAIRARGSKAKRYLQGTREKLQSELPNYLSTVVERIKENWRR
jgi:hypothetical protein